MRAIPLLLVLLACSDGPGQAAVDLAHADDETPGEKVARILAEGETAGPVGSDDLARQVASIEDRLARLEATVADIHHVGLGEADRVRFDPSRTTLDAKSVQEALDELAAALHDLKEGGVSMGQPGEAFFNLHHEGPLGPVRGDREGQGPGGPGGESHRGPGGDHGGPGGESGGPERGSPGQDRR